MVSFITLIQCGASLLISFNMVEYYLDEDEQVQTKASPGSVPAVKWYSGLKHRVQRYALLLCKFTCPGAPRLLSKQQNEQFLVQNWVLELLTPCEVVDIQFTVLFVLGVLICSCYRIDLVYIYISVLTKTFC